MLQDSLRALLVIPMPFLVLGTGGLILWRWRRTSRALLAASAAGLLLTSLPVTGKLIVLPLLSLTEGWEPTGEPVDAFLVPTSGIYFDERKRWWANAASVRRLGAALAARDAAAALGHSPIPIIISGGAKKPGAPAEALVLARQFNLSYPEVVLDTAALDSYETAVNLERQSRGLRVRHLVVFTDPTHMARMAGVLRHKGFEVRRVTKARIMEAGLNLDRFSFTDLVPQPNGFHLNRRAFYELAGISWYLVTGRLSLGDLSSGP